MLPKLTAKRLLLNFKSLSDLARGIILGQLYEGFGLQNIIVAYNTKNRVKSMSEITILINKFKFYLEKNNGRFSQVS